MEIKAIESINKRKLGQGTFFNMLAKLTYLFCGYIIFIVIARVLGPNKYGIYGVIFAFLYIVYLFLRSGIPYSVPKYIAGDESNAYPILKSALRIQLAWATFLFLLLFVGAEAFAKIVFKDEGLTHYLRLASLTIIPFALYNVYDSVLLGVRNFTKQAIALIFRAILRLILVVGLVLLGYGIEGAIIGNIFAAVFATLIVFSFCKFVKSKGKFAAGKLITFAIPLIVSGGMITLLLNMDSILVKRIIGNNEQVGFYIAAATTAHALYHMFTALGLTIFPSVAMSYKNNDLALTKKYIYQSIRYTLLISMPIVAVISASSGELINLLYGSRYFQASAPLSILIFGNSLFALSLVLNTIISAIGRPWLASLFYSCGAIIGLLCNVYLIGKFGIFGAGVAISIAYAFCLIGASIYIYRLYRTLINWKSLLRILSPAVLLFFIARFFTVSGILLPIYFIALFALYGIFVWILGELNREDYQVVQGIFGRKLVFSSE